MNTRLTLAILITTALATAASAAVIAPVKNYAKPDEPIAIKFLNEKNDDAKKALQLLGADAAKLDSLFSPAPAAEVFIAGIPSFTAFTATGDVIKPAVGIGASPDGSVDLAKLFPKLKEAGTYYIVWNDAAPLVVETLRNPVDWAVAKDTKQNADLRRSQLQNATSGDPVVTHLVQAEYAVITTDKGVVKAKFAYDVAPHTVDNFISLSRQGMYDHSAFHRIKAGFMIQGGDSFANDDSRAGSGGPGYNIPAELSDKKHVKGTLSMARMGFSEDTAGSQFFIMHGVTQSLDGGYSAFGDVFEGLDVVDTLAATKSAPQSFAVDLANRPKIITIQILPATADIYGLKKK